ncbi:MAG: hypothetical protein ACJ71M_14085 [Nitrososphaeraceae archaeon]
MEIYTSGLAQLSDQVMALTARMHEFEREQRSFGFQTEYEMIYASAYYDVFGKGI